VILLVIKLTPELNRPQIFFSAWLFELAGGAIPDYEDTCIPKSQREAAFTLAALHQWEMDFDDARCTEAAEEVRLLIFHEPRTELFILFFCL
jgi:hypothetical protein